MKHKMVCFSVGLYESSYRCTRCGIQTVFSIEEPKYEEEIRNERCPVGQRAVKIIRKLVNGDVPEATIRQHYGMTKQQLERFKNHHAKAIHVQETRKFGKIFHEEL